MPTRHWQSNASARSGTRSAPLAAWARPRSSLVGLAALLSVTACAATMANGTLEVASCDRPPAGTTAVLLTPNAITLNPGGSLALSAANQAGRPIPACALRWTSSDSSAISVEPSGLVRAQRAGRSAEISATAVAGVARGVAQIRVAPAGPQ